MRITIPDVKAPFCQCGEKAEVFLYPNNLKVKCNYCGKEARVHYTTAFYRFSISDLADLIAIIGNKEGEE